MPIEHVITNTNHLLVIRGSEAGSVEETEVAVRRAIDSIVKGEIPRGSGVIFSVDALDLSLSEYAICKVTECLILLQKHLQGFLAIVASEVGKVTSAHLMAFGASGRIGKVRAFTDDSQAREWLLARND